MNRNSAAAELAMWRRATAELYSDARHADDPQAGWERFVHSRSQLFKEHPQSPLDAGQRTRLGSLPYFPYDIRLRTVGRLNYDVAPQLFTVDLGADGPLQYRRVANVHFRFATGSHQLSLFWIGGYGGGLFLPFKDGTSGDTTYGGGRYLYDTVEGADLGLSWDAIPLDFNFAYNPSCAYNLRWISPLPPEENWLDIPLPAGERLFQ